MRDLAVTLRPIDSLIPYARNSRTHSNAQVAQIAASIREFGWTNPVLLDGDGTIIAGHGRVLAARVLALQEVPCIEIKDMTDAQKRAYIIADNKLAENAGWDSELLALELGDLQAGGFDINLTGFDELEVAELFESTGDISTAKNEAHETLAERFGASPFSVMDARRGWWIERKRAWLASGIQSEAGRGEELTFALSAQPPSAYQAKNKYEASIGRTVSWEEFAAAKPDEIKSSGTSIFDPVLCELAYRWFCPPSGQIVDPFAGGSVRGWVAAKTGRAYFGCDLRAEQIEENRSQWAQSGNEDVPAPVWHCGDSLQIDQHAKGIQADMVFSCPPYADLEVYSKDPADLSNMGYAEFIEAYREIIKKSVATLKQDRFACFVVGEVRDKNGIYRNFVGDTIQAFIDAGASYYNEAILVTNIGSLAIRAAEAFTKSRKLGKTHQNILIFVKGDPRKATAACGTVEIDPALFETESVD